MLKLSIKNPTTQETETYDVVTEFNQFFNQAKEYGLINSIFSLRVNAMRDENAPIRLHADSDVGNGLRCAKEILYGKNQCRPRLVLRRHLRRQGYHRNERQEA